MRNLIIIGAGGMGRTIYDMALENNGYLKDFQIKGFIDDDIHQLDRFGNYPPIISTIKSLGGIFTPQVLHFPPRQI